MEINLGGTFKGYKVFYWNKKQGYAHRFSYLIYCSVISSGNYIFHKCDNPGCVNPIHLFEGSPKDNYHDIRKKERDNHAYGERLSTSKLTKEDVIDILNIKYNSIDEIAVKLKVSRNVPEKILKEKSGII